MSRAYAIEGTKTLLVASLWLTPVALSQPKGVQKISTTEKISVVGLTLQQALAKPDSTILVGTDGKETTVAELKRRKQLRDQSIAGLSNKPALKGRVVSRPSEAGLSHVKAIVESLATENSAAASLRTAALSKKVSAPASAAGKLSEAMKPRLDTVNGKTRNFRVSPGGYLTIEGFGFGEVMGQSNVIGQFPGGAAALRVVDWKNTMVYALFPPGIRGVLDHDVNIQLISHDGKTFRLDGGKFVATRGEEFDMTDQIHRLIKFRAYGWAATMDDHGLVDRWGVGTNINCPSPGADNLEALDPGRGFVVTGMGMHFGRTDSGDGDVDGMAGSRTFFPGYDFGDWAGNHIPARWGVWRSHTSPSFGGILDGVDVCRSRYQIDVTVVGPLGVPF